MRELDLQHRKIVKEFLHSALMAKASLCNMIVLGSAQRSQRIKIEN